MYNNMESFEASWERLSQCLGAQGCVERRLIFFPPMPPKGGCGESAFPRSPENRRASSTPRKSLRFGIEG